MSIVGKIGKKLFGQEDDKAEETASLSAQEVKEKAQQFFAALGGIENVQQIDACITRLRLTVKEITQINEDELKAIGAMGVVKLGSNNLQIILGPIAESISDEMRAVVGKK